MRSYIKTFYYFFFLCLLCNIFADTNYSDKFIVKFKTSKIENRLLFTNQITKQQLIQSMMKPLLTSQIHQLENITNIGLLKENSIRMADGSHIIKIIKPISNQIYLDALKKLNQDSQIDYAEPVVYFSHQSSSEFNEKQWDMFQLGDNFLLSESNQRVQKLKYQGDGVIVAVIDTGYTAHTNYINNLVEYEDGCVSKNGYNNKCYGYQFISSCDVANEGGQCPTDDSMSYHPDALDVGDYTSGKNSSWHGSHVIGTIVATGYESKIDARSILGGASSAKVVPIRVLGAGGGSNYDVANAIYWAVDAYSGIKNNHPAQVINLSLGSASNCSRVIQDAISTAIQNGAIVVVAAGNKSSNIMGYSPAGCVGVISVSAKNKNNSLTSYSNYGNTTITASGGDSSGAILSTIWDNTRNYTYSKMYSGYKSYSGTSMATPHVVATITDMIEYFRLHDMNYNTGLIVSILRNSANNLTISSNNGGSVGKYTLNTLEAINYLESHLTRQLKPSQDILYINNNQQSITFSNTKSIQTIFVKKIEILDDKNIGIDEIKIVSNTCIGQIGADQSCNVKLTTNMNALFNGVMNLLDENNNIVGTVGITTFSNNLSTNNNGGCSFVINSSDYSLITLLVICFFIILFKNRCKKR